MKFLPILLLLAAAPLLWAQSDAPASNVTNVTSEAAEKLLAEKKDMVVLDLRTPEEFKAGHIPGATNIDFLAANFATNLASLDKTKTCLVHCASGGRSTRALPVFQEQKFQSVMHLDGGFKGWQAAGKAVEPAQDAKK